MEDIVVRGRAEKRIQERRSSISLIVWKRTNVLALAVLFLVFMLYFGYTFIRLLLEYKNSEIFENIEYLNS